MTRNSVEPSDGELYEQLVGYLDAEGAVEEDTERGVVTITEFDPVRSRRRSTSSSRRCRRGAHLRAVAPSPALVWPDLPAVEAAWRLSHLEETVRTAKPGETELVLDRTGVQTWPS
jgi:hypothetical protein